MGAVGDLDDPGVGVERSEAGRVEDGRTATGRRDGEVVGAGDHDPLAGVAAREQEHPATLAQPVDGHLGCQEGAALVPAAASSPAGETYSV